MPSRKSLAVRTCLAALAAVGLIACALAMISRSKYPGGSLYDETLAGVKVGMHRERVEALIGPPRDAWNRRRASFAGPRYQQRGYYSWIGRDSELLVLFDSQGVAVDIKNVTTFAVNPPN